MANREYTNAVGRRKETTATVKLYAKGAWNYVVKTASGKEYSLADYFGWNVYLYQNAILPFTTLGADVLKKFDAEIKIVGWGIAGQSDAIRLAFSRALVEWNSDLRPSGWNKLIRKKIEDGIVLMLLERLLVDWQ